MKNDLPEPSCDAWYCLLSSPVRSGCVTLYVKLSSAEYVQSHFLLII